MKVVVCGAGQVGANIARYLAGEGSDVTVIDRSAELIRRMSDTVDVQAIVGHASLPTVLERAGAEDADILIAVTHSDEVNMVACQVAHSLFSVPMKIARVREQAYLTPDWSNLFQRDAMPIDVIISPELEVARAIVRRLRVPGAFDAIPLADDLVRIIGVNCNQDCPIVNTPLRQLTGLFPDLNIEVLAIIRGNRAIIPSANEQMLPGDDVYFAAETSHVPRALRVFGHEEPEARRVCIIGGGHIGLLLAEELERHHQGLAVRMIESDAEQGARLADRLSRTTVLVGDGLDPELLEEANIGATAVVVAVTNDDETNILSSLLAKRYGCQRSITLLNKNSYDPLIATLGIDAVINPRSITASTVLQHVRRGRIIAVHVLRDGFAEIIEAEALETSPLLNTPIRQIKLPADVRIGALVRRGKVIIPGPQTVIQAQDRVILLAGARSVRKIEKLFAVRLEFF